MANCHRNSVGSIALDHRHTEKNATAGGHFRVLRRLIFDAVSCGGTSRYRYRQRGGGEGNVADFSSVTSHAEKEERSEKRSEKLSDLLNAAETKTDAEAERKEEALAELKRVVKELREEDLSMRRIAAERVRSLTKEDAEARANLAMLGAIPPLVGMLDSEDAHSQIASLYALLNLGIGNDANKATIVKIGTVHKMLKLIESSDSNSSVAEAIVANFLGLSALDSNKPIVGSSGAIPFLVCTLTNLEASKTVSPSQSQVKQDALRALYNLSICQSNLSVILETDLVWFLVSAIGDMEVSERSLAILSNLVSTPEGRKAISGVSDAIPILVDVLSWTDSPECQEKASYVLMIMAHKTYGDRRAMIEAGIVSSLLELTLVGTTLAQKRASRILECLRVDKGKQVSGSYAANLNLGVSAPICGGSSSSEGGGGGRGSLVEEEDGMMMSEEKKAVKQLVQQSLQNNMIKIVKRANLRRDFVPSAKIASLTSSSTSKSLPF
ncbi:U-box domain-containing protein 4 [Vigna radiata var. radiata]|uniref:U-box domain-containing protein 4 n=1 Tax=Vigna radiata var. radiata TaxID=3916 RepID=A0A1S3U1G0_VIGRR|nr:U-box domain-containing protein 4 [Vigna radiata var. radiata]